MMGMKAARHALGVLSSIVLVVGAACSEGGGSPVRPTPGMAPPPALALESPSTIGTRSPSRPPPRTETTTILAFGDSFTEGFVRTSGSIQTAVQPRSAYPFRLQLAMAERYSAQEITVINAGIGGETAAEGRERFVGELLNVQPSVVLLFEGFNDISLALLVGSPEPFTATIADDLRNMVRAAQARGAEVLIATLPPVGDQRERVSPGQRSAVEDLNRRIRTVAALAGIGPAVDLETRMTKADIGPDGFHPTVDGYARIARIFLSAIIARYEQPLMLPIVRPPGESESAEMAPWSTSDSGVR